MIPTWNIAIILVWLLEFCILPISKVISGQVPPICECMHSWWLYSAAPLGDEIASTMIWYPTQSHYPDTERSSTCPTLLMPSTRLGSSKYQFLSHCFDSTRVRDSNPISQNGERKLYSFGHQVGFLILGDSAIVEFEFVQADKTVQYFRMSPI